jgi:hypothetical protein
MEYVLVALAGWVGAGWPISIGRGGGTAGIPDPEDPNPPLCWVCTFVIGAIAAVILWLVLAQELGPDAGFGTKVVFGLIAGSFGGSLVRGLLGLGKRNTTVSR